MEWSGLKSIEGMEWSEENTRSLGRREEDER